VRFSTAKFPFDIYKMYVEIFPLFLLRLLSSALSIVGVVKIKNPKRHSTAKNPNIPVQLECNGTGTKNRMSRKI
jgi:hypothetical protein